MDGQTGRNLASLARMPATDVILAPAAGSGIGKMLAEALLADPEFMPAMKAACMGGLKATRTWWDKSSRSMQSEPDSRVQVQTVALLLAHMEGEPIKRIIHQHLGGDGSGIDPLAALRDSPALLAAVKREVEKAEWRSSGRNGKKRDPQPVEAADIEVPTVSQQGTK